MTKIHRPFKTHLNHFVNYIWSRNFFKKSRFTQKDNAKGADLNYRSLVVMWMIILLYNKVHFDKSTQMSRICKAGINCMLIKYCARKKRKRRNKTKNFPQIKRKKVLKEI